MKIGPLVVFVCVAAAGAVHAEPPASEESPTGTGPLDLMRSPEPADRIRALAGLEQGGDLEVIFVVSLLDDDPAADVRRRAAQALGVMRGQRATEALKICIAGRKQEATVVRACRVALAEVAAHAPEPLALVERPAESLAPKPSSGDGESSRPFWKPVAATVNASDFVMYEGASAGAEWIFARLPGAALGVAFTGAWVGAHVGGVGMSSIWYAVDLQPTYYLRRTPLEGPYASLRFFVGSISMTTNMDGKDDVTTSGTIRGATGVVGWSWIPIPNLLVRLGIGLGHMSHSAHAEAGSPLTGQGFGPAADLTLGYVF